MLRVRFQLFAAAAILMSAVAGAAAADHQTPVEALFNGNHLRLTKAGHELSYRFQRSVSHEKVLGAALDAGVTLFDTAALYGFGANESLVGPVLKPYRSRITLCSKGGMAGVKGDDGVTRRVIDGRPESIRRDCEDSLRRLQTDVIDLYAGAARR